MSEWVQVAFDAGHSRPCPHTRGSHGHRYTIRAVVVGTYEPGRLSMVGDLRDGLFALRAELEGTVIDDMLPGVETTEAGIAAWVLERLPMAASVRVATNADQGSEVWR